jgi:phage FluMu protein Com
MQQQMPPNTKIVRLKCDNCQSLFDVKSNPDGTMKTHTQCPHCKQLLEIEFNDGEETSAG